MNKRCKHERWHLSFTDTEIVLKCSECGFKRYFKQARWYE